MYLHGVFFYSACVCCILTGPALLRTLTLTLTINHDPHPLQPYPKLLQPTTVTQTLMTPILTLNLITATIAILVEQLHFPDHYNPNPNCDGNPNNPNRLIISVTRPRTRALT